MLAVHVLGFRAIFNLTCAHMPMCTHLPNIWEEEGLSICATEFSRLHGGVLWGSAGQGVALLETG
jgi:hypothetical protein